MPPRGFPGSAPGALCGGASRAAPGDRAPRRTVSSCPSPRVPDLPFSVPPISPPPRGPPVPPWRGASPASPPRPPARRGCAPRSSAASAPPCATRRRTSGAWLGCPTSCCTAAAASSPAAGAGPTGPRARASGCARSAGCTGRRNPSLWLFCRRRRLPDARGRQQVPAARPHLWYLEFPDWPAPRGRTATAGAATLRDLLTMTAGLGYEDCPSYRPLMAKVRDRRISDLRALCDAIGRLPLRSKPGSRYDYSFCHDLLGRLCEVISGKRLDIFMRHLLKPLGMKDTHFALPPRKKRPSLNRRSMRGMSVEGGRRRAAVRARPYALKLYRHKHSAPGILSCGGGILSYLDAGMWGTACDYARFCQMILDGGVAPGGGRVLRPATARALWSDALAPLGRARDGRLPGWHDADGPRPGGWWDYRGLSLLHAYLDHDLPPRGGRPPRRSQSMWFSGGGGAFWKVEEQNPDILASWQEHGKGSCSRRPLQGPCRALGPSKNSWGRKSRSLGRGSHLQEPR
ncbi:unnamed protein product [Prorocentrum cordatum]|uniref:Beta-lactamase-related domain-containing protein n=1 Tax=Prorocentrum cordatum TaxID=2364126 RepID=A0ABN9XAP3_9DINO|nr:unnamed protein product [Polarella glacialis]